MKKYSLEMISYKMDSMFAQIAPEGSDFSIVSLMLFTFKNE